MLNILFYNIISNKVTELINDILINAPNEAFKIYCNVEINNTHNIEVVNITNLEEFIRVNGIHMLITNSLNEITKNMLNNSNYPILTLRKHNTDKVKHIRELKDVLINTKPTNNNVEVKIEKIDNIISESNRVTIPKRYEVKVANKTRIRKNIINNFKEITDDDENVLNYFLKIYNVDKAEVFSNPKVEFRYECFKNINYMRSIILPEIKQNLNNEAVLIEYRCFPHLEFLIRNTIYKLGDKWSHTIVCGISNYDYIINMCNNISANIKIIKTEFDNLNPGMYNKMFSSEYFWDYFEGEKILIYQEDSIIFKNNIEDFMNWDYIGAPWPKNQNDNIEGVGNGGISIRSKSIMKKIIEKISIEDTKFNSTTIDYVNKFGLKVFPEDVYFTKNMEDFNIGLLADRNSASLFSTESILNNNSFAGHNFWIADNKNWKQRIYDNIVIKFKPNYTNISSYYQHRGGWKSVITKFIDNNFYSYNSNIDFFDMLEHQFLWNRGFVCYNKWCGIFHVTPITPSYLHCVNISGIFENQNFINSLNSCICIFTLSEYLSKYLRNKFKELNISVDVVTFKHPVEMNNIKMFNINDYFNNYEKKIIQIGQQLRKITSIYLLKNTNNHIKYWLTGFKDLNRCKWLLNQEINYFGIHKNELDKNVKMYYTKTFDEYDILLSKNVVFVDLFDAAANNTVVECIIRNTPLIVNKIDGVVDYLGEDYPLYFKDLNEIPGLLVPDKIKLAYNYLKNMSKEELHMDYFVNNVITYLHKKISL
jgi:hypothetical protein